MSIPTRYEIEARHPDGTRFYIGETARLSRIGLLKVMQAQGDAIVAALAIGEDDQIAFGAKPKAYATTSNGWWVGFTGRTSKDAATEGNVAPALPSLATVGA